MYVGLRLYCPLVKLGKTTGQKLGRQCNARDRKENSQTITLMEIGSLMKLTIPSAVVVAAVCRSPVRPKLHVPQERSDRS